MALRSSLALVILLLVLQQLKLCKGGSDIRLLALDDNLPYTNWVTVAGELQTAEVYEIDYKGPETHAFLPPPGHSRFAPSTGSIVN